MLRPDTSSGFPLPLSLVLPLLANTLPGASCWNYSFLTDAQMPEFLPQVSPQNQIHQEATGGNYHLKRHTTSPFLDAWWRSSDPCLRASLRSMKEQLSFLPQLQLSSVSFPFHRLSVNKIICLSILLESKTWDLLTRKMAKWEDG